MRKVLIPVLAALVLSACGQSEAERDAVDLERRRHEVDCEILQDEADRLDAGFMRGMYDMSACPGDVERYGVVIRRAEALQCQNFTHTNMDRHSCTPLNQQWPEEE